MFDFAISQNQQRRPTKRLYASWVVSCIVHLCFVLILIRFPGLLRGGRYHRFHPLSAIERAFGIQSQEEEEKDWRTVTVLRTTPMEYPSAATLKKYLHDFEKGPANEPVHVRWGDEQRKALENGPPIPKVKQTPQASVTLPAPNQGGLGSPDAASAQNQPGKTADAASGGSVVQIDPNAGKRGTMNLPQPGPPARTEMASNTAPDAIPNGVKPPSTMSPQKEAVKVFENEKEALRSPETGLFDVNNGFPIGEYANLIKERIKGKWYIPSNLKNSQGHTTIIFYIGKDGRYSNARIEPSASSGNNSLNLAALKAIMDSSPFPPLPKNYPGDHVGAKFVLSYNEP
jgi:TonB family protein